MEEAAVDVAPSQFIGGRELQSRSRARGRGHRIALPARQREFGLNILLEFLRVAQGGKVMSRGHHRKDRSW